MIYVTQGHEKGIGLEVFVKSFLQLSISDQKNFKLIGFRKSLEETLNLSKISFKFFHNHYQIGASKLQFEEPGHQQLFESSSCLIHALERIKKSDFLFTLPTSKDQLFLKKKNQPGHTEFFRSFYQNKDISMFFFSPNIKTLLITDHIALKDVGSKISPKLIQSKIELVLSESKKYHLCQFDEILISGINPHVGENGLLGTEDKKIYKAIDSLKKSFPKVNFLGPFSGDTLSLHLKPNRQQLLVYMFHDQGLSFFKSQMGLLGINISLGLPFLRTSVDHGTAFELYGKNQANFSGCLYVMKEMLKLKRR
jgi:4-hydroxythreonine-4-phosphate dehydrogenase